MKIIYRIICRLLLFFGYEDKSFELYKKHVMERRKEIPSTDLTHLRPNGHGERRIFTIPVGNLNEEDADEYVRRVAEKFKRNPPIGTMTGRFDPQYTPLSIDEDIFIPQRVDTPSGILYYVDFKYGDKDVERKEWKLPPSDTFNR